MPDRSFRNCDLPPELYYDVGNHVWVRPEAGGLYTLGITDPGQTLSGELLYCAHKPVGTLVGVSKALATIESGKSIWPVRCPIAGEIVELNALVEDEPITINRDPYGEGWIVRMKAAGGAAGLNAGLRRLVTGAEVGSRYLPVLEELGFGQCIPVVKQR
jgi:glycine cleavage system H protein